MLKIKQILIALVAIMFLAAGGKSVSSEDEVSEEKDEDRTSETNPKTGSINQRSQSLISTRPPWEFQSKNKQYKLFSEPVQTWKKFPCSLHFRDAMPTSQALHALELLSEMLGPVGKYEGSYGAGGGPIHILYLGAPSDDDNKITENAKESSSFASLETIVGMLRLSPDLASLQWMTTLDPLHQSMFPKTMEDTIQFTCVNPSWEEYDQYMNSLSSNNNRWETLFWHHYNSWVGQYLNSWFGVYGQTPPPRPRPEDTCSEQQAEPALFQQFYSLLHPHEKDTKGDNTAHRSIPIRLYNDNNHNTDVGCSIEPRLTRNFSFLKEPRIVFVQPKFRSIHDGACRRSGCPMDDSMICERTVQGENREPGDVDQSPVFAVIQLYETGELIALAQWDYRD